MAGYAGFSRGFATGFGLMDAYIARKDARERADRLDTENTRRWNITNDRAAEQAGLQNDLTRRQLQEYDLNQAADIYSGIVSNPDGSPVDISKLTPEQMQAKKAQLQQVINRTKPFRDILTQNPNVDPENPLADMQFMMDQKTQQPSVMFNLRMKDGTVKPLTANRSSDPNDGVVVMPLSQLDQNMQAVLGRRGEMGVQRATAAEIAKEGRKYKQDLGLESVKHRNAMELQGVKDTAAAARETIKAGGVVPGSGAMTGKALKEQLDAASKVLKNELGSQDPYGNFSVNGDKVGNELSLYGTGELLASHLLSTGQATDGREAATRAISTLKQIQANGGGITYDRERHHWVMFDGSKAADGTPNYTILAGDASPARTGATDNAGGARAIAPPPAAIERLRANPTDQEKAQFDEVFGEGAADKALGASKKKAGGADKTSKSDLELVVPPPKPKPVIPKGTSMNEDEIRRAQQGDLSMVVR